MSSCFFHLLFEDFELKDGDEKFDLVFAIRVGALDGRHPEEGKLALRNMTVQDRLIFLAYNIPELLCRLI